MVWRLTAEHMVEKMGISSKMHTTLAAKGRGELFPTRDLAGNRIERSFAHPKLSQGRGGKE